MGKAEDQERSIDTDEKLNKEQKPSDRYHDKDEIANHALFRAHGHPVVTQNNGKKQDGNNACQKGNHLLYPLWNSWLKKIVQAHKADYDPQVPLHRKRDKDAHDDKRPIEYCLQFLPPDLPREKDVGQRGNDG